ncbi:MAG: ribulose-phosphate 3-epimerase [Bacillati bacterium ANGP1]|uniref:Ribulose-phosphate 3-epimerase n=1 Tax=Candidatus Segetimicrobium genomatis TaxID=2569760 RepID=A0A537LFM6_9BACT|nr:MAG: ribulose-phosphate 3-epimerase [Terrabacteria group bacterium ANGP1]
MRIAASILAADFARLNEQVEAAQGGGADSIHVDVMDGRFVPEISIGPVIIDAVRRSTSLPVDVHLMIVEPDRQLDRCVRSGASSITVHVEASHLHRVIQQIKDLGAKACVALNPATPLVTVEPMLGELDMVLLMTVNPGYAGQRFIPAVLPKVRQLREWIATHGLALDVQVDGGINESTAAQAVAAGANVLVAASAIFQSEGGIEASVRRLRQAALAAEVRK